MVQRSSKPPLSMTCAWCGETDFKADTVLLSQHVCDRCLERSLDRIRDAVERLNAPRREPVAVVRYRLAG